MDLNTAATMKEFVPAVKDLSSATRPRTASIKYRPILSPDLNARLAAAPTAPKRMLQARARDARVSELRTAERKVEREQAERRLYRFREELKDGFEARGFRRRAVKVRDWSKNEDWQEARAVRRANSLETFGSVASKVEDFKTGMQRRIAEVGVTEENALPPPSTRQPSRPRAPTPQSPHRRGLVIPRPPNSSHVPSPLSTPFNTPAPSPPHSPAPLALRVSSEGSAQMQVYFQEENAWVPYIQTNQLASHQLAHLSTARALLLLAHSPKEAAKVFENARKVFPLGAVMEATRQAERIILGREIKHWKIGVPGLSPSREERYWLREAADGFVQMGKEVREEREGRASGERRDWGNAMDGKELVEIAEREWAEGCESQGTETACGDGRKVGGKGKMSLGAFLAEG